MIQPFAWSARQLLLGPIYEDDARLWKALQTHLGPLTDYFASIGLQLEMAPQDGYAFLHDAAVAGGDDAAADQIDGADDNDAPGDGTSPGLRPLLRQHPLSYETSLLAVVLRHWLGEYDQAGQPDGPKLLVSLAEVQERVALLLPPAPNQVKLLKTIRGYVRELGELGMLTLRHDDPLDPRRSRYEVRRILMARLSPEMLEEFQQALAGHARQATGQPLDFADPGPAAA